MGEPGRSVSRSIQLDISCVLSDCENGQIYQVQLCRGLFEAHDLQDKCPSGPENPHQDETGFDLMVNSILFATPLQYQRICRYETIAKLSRYVVKRRMEWLKMWPDGDLHFKNSHN